MQKYVPFHVKNLPILYLVITICHLIVKTIMLKHLGQHFYENDTNTHFLLTAVLTGFLCLLFSLVIVDMLFRTHSTWRYVIGMNLSVVACALFVIGYMLGNVLEIWFAKMAVLPCRQLGIGTNTTEVLPDGTDLDSYVKGNCEEAVNLAFFNISIDFLIHIFFVPLHIFASAFSWTFSDLYRKRIFESE
ncbi:hypothetical protein L3Y34_017349 [Caenorhabditis briggsae]|uniref:Uncharacterized protein n=2 Tax=Caenorhabditis briggsae TaxID=6238 RepID=A0AAE9IT44_CAEBR|nr:hypothetical protein L3Y34_017349 [Caenorhabditis briggsae]